MMALDDFFAEARPTEAEELEPLRKSVEDTAAVGGGLWLSYLFVLFYLGIAAGGYPCRSLVAKSSQAAVPKHRTAVACILFLAPLLFLIVHAYTLVHLVLLAGRVAQFNAAVSDRPSEDDGTWRRRLPSNIFVQFLGAPEEERYSIFGLLPAAILWVTLVIAPIALLLLLQIQFLPYHNWWITWVSRIVLILDLALLWWLWGRILSRRAKLKRAHIWWLEDHLPTKSVLDSLRGWIFAGNVDNTTRRRRSLSSNTLVLPWFNIYEALKIDDLKKVEWKKHLIDLRGRDLKGAVLYGAVLPKSDLTGAQLQGASLFFVQLQGASLDLAELQGAELGSARLQGASLNEAHFRAPRSAMRSFRAPRSMKHGFGVRRS